MSQSILVINSGSSSIKFSLFATSDFSEHASGLAERLGTAEAQLTVKAGQNKQQVSLADGDITTALKAILDTLSAEGLLTELPIAIGHRVVHGGESFSDPVLIDDSVIAEIKRCSQLAPLHNPANLAGIQALASLYPTIPQVAVFDTAFHQTLEPQAFLYPIPYELYREHGVRRYGFHGVSHQYVSEQAIQRLALGENSGVITAHLGNGCSATAVVNGKSVDTTMGLTPLEGLMMGTRSGDVDPGLHGFLANKLGWSLEKITNLLNKESGLLGISGISNDMRSLSEAAEVGNEQAALAIRIFCFRLARQIAGLAASLPRWDALVFTGGIGENAADIRATVIEHLKVFGFELNEEANQAPAKHGNLISAAGSQIKVMVIPTAEEKVIATATHALI